MNILYTLHSGLFKKHCLTVMGDLTKCTSNLGTCVEPEEIEEKEIAEKGMVFRWLISFLLY